MRFSIHGDSHVNPFKINDPAIAGRPNPFHIPEYISAQHRFATDADQIAVYTYTSSTAIGLDSSSSENGSGARIFANVQQELAEGAETLAFCFGRVDLDFVYPYKRIIQGSDLNLAQFAGLSRANYLSFLLRLEERVVKGRARIVVLGLPAPILPPEDMAHFVWNDSIRQHIANANGVLNDDIGRPPADTDKARLIETIAPLSVRTQASVALNQALAYECGACGFGFVDLDATMVDTANGTVRPDFVAGRDHHAYPQALGPLWLQLLRTSVGFAA
ncbi:hypothetical protein DMC25_17280 [Caulobacter sp. D4A]|uniref:hypothetical protein n=1 Tax=unclassified Caulobacter TaxID=2648921 RepID=UPI000D72C884|nr:MULTISPECIES: hypothetical protein [unclassified Caulobacter]PXA84011.1 hypothetical protein DMC25_17280 [Caulobacter sp. D4A]PXA94279.1 hypothetical protein DMC18_06650 [Caulobacter sp. D5]